ncbi:MAG: hypothetical protein HY360_17475 [Verrucomicrobia bacterium]|nr:hypothetical protein [Verrucomicrobiota bacterium]
MHTRLFITMTFLATLGRIAAAEKEGFVAQGVFYEPPVPGVRAVIPFNPNAITLDGVIDDKEWFASSAFTGFMDNTNRQYAPRQTVVHACFNQDSLWLAFQSDAPRNDDQERLVVALKTAGGLQVLSLHSSGRLDSVGPARLKKEAETKSTVSGNQWRCELRIPFEGLGLACPTKELAVRGNFSRVFDSPLVETSWTAKSLDDAHAFAENEMGELILKRDAPYLKVFSLGAIDRHQMRVKGTLYEPAQGSGDAQKELFVSWPVEIHGQKRGYSNSIYYQPGKPAPLKVVCGPGLDDDQLVFPHRETDSITFTFRAGGYNGPALQHTERFPVGKAFDELAFYSWKILPGNLWVAWLQTLGIKGRDLGRLALKASMFSPSNALLENKEIKAVRNGTWELEFNAGRLELGTNTFQAALTGPDGKTIATLTKPIIKPDAAQWENNRIGLSDKVPAPFEPVQRKGNSLRCWGREYLFNEGLMAQVVSEGQSLLAGPITLEAASATENLVLKPAKWRFNLLGATAAVASNVFTCASFDLQVQETMEFDGMIRVDLTLAPKSPDRLKRLALKIPFKPAHARYLNWTRSTSAGDRSAHAFGALPKDGFTGDFRPFVWLGDEDRGLLWFAESMRNWAARKKNRMIQVKPTADAVELVVTMIDHEIVLDKPFTITFGLQASPVRPRPPRWREFTQKFALFSSNIADITCHNPGVVRAEAAMLEERVKDGGKVIIYAYPRWLNTNVPAYKFFANEWRAGGPLTRTPYGYDIDSMCSRSGFTEFNVWAEKTALDALPIRHCGLLYDLAWAGPCSHANSTYRDEHGETQPSWDIFALREYYKRVYTLFRQRMTETRITAHSSANSIQLPLFSFCDAAWDGEQYAPWIRDYIREVPPDQWRAELTGRQFGMVPLFLPELRYWEPGEKEVAANFALATMIYLHDTMVFSGHNNDAVFAPYEKLKDEFGIGEPDVVFLPYWEDRSKGFQPGHPDILVGAYTRPGRALIIAGNLSDQPVDTAIRLPPETFKFTPATIAIYDGASRKDAQLKDGEIKVQLPSKRPTFITLNAGEAVKP